MALTLTTAYMAFDSKNVIIFQERWGPLVYSTLIIAVVVSVRACASTSEAISYAPGLRLMLQTPPVYAGIYTTIAMASMSMSALRLATLALMPLPFYYRVRQVSKKVMLYTWGKPSRCFRFRCTPH
jgi:hypothetical protein